MRIVALAGAAAASVAPAGAQLPSGVREYGVYANLVTEEGGDPAQIRAAAPATKPWTWIGKPDYPADALDARREGWVRLKLDVDAAGAVAGCTVTESHADAALADFACRTIAQRARFVPALAPDGSRVGDTAEIFVSFSIALESDPQFPPAPPAPPPPGWPLMDGTSTLQMIARPDFSAASAMAEERPRVVGLQLSGFPLPDGPRVRCSVLDDGGSAPVARAACDAAEKTGRYRITTSRPFYNYLSMLVRFDRGKASITLPRRAQGKPVGGKSSIAVPLRGIDPALITQRYPGAEIEADATGKLRWCRITATTGSDAADTAICAAARKLKLSPAVDVFGRKMTARGRVVPVLTP